MPDGTRFFLGYGERITSRISPPPGGGGPELAYEFDEALARIAPMVMASASNFNALPRVACPNDQAVGIVTLHPQWMAKSYHPQQLLNQYNLRQVGSRPITVVPEKWTRRADPEESPSSELFVAGTRASFDQWTVDLQESSSRISDQIRRIESVRAPSAEDRLRGIRPQHELDSELTLLEVVLHTSAAHEDDFILAGFQEFSSIIGLEPNFDRRIYAGGLCFVPVWAPQTSITALTQFAFLRVARPMPRLREIGGFERSIATLNVSSSPLPTEGAVDPRLAVAVFDGGLSEESPLLRWASAQEGHAIGNPVESLLAHGHDVTSALLFGHIVPGEAAPRPYARVDHFRVLDDTSQDDPFELYDTLRRIEVVLRQRSYKFVNLSIGPRMPIDDDEVHTWTALLDEYLSDGSVLATLACGNTGTELDGESRIQVPADCVNALSVGSADSLRSDWSRSRYSSLGPGRSPGIVKPDVLHFGGTETEPFYVYDATAAPHLAWTQGTSFAAPSALRLAVGIHAHFGSRVQPLTLKALLIHSAETLKHEPSEVGWGRIPSEILPFVSCEDGIVRVIYQGRMSPAQYLRCPIPLPEEPLMGRVSIHATFCFATPVDPQDPGTYTRSGLDITFRPDATDFRSDESTVPRSKSFFRRSDYDTEQSLRNDAQKWETTLSRNRAFNSSTLNRPMFDVHYNARSAGGAPRSPENIRYALVVTVRARRIPDLYDRVLRAYAGRLEALVPIMEIPVRV